jgi:hypothetical protein
MSGFDKLIREKAYELWERAGRPEGRDVEFWHAAKHELEAEPPAVKEGGGSADPSPKAPPVAEEKAAPANAGAASRRRRNTK